MINWAMKFLRILNLVILNIFKLNYRKLFDIRFRNKK